MSNILFLSHRLPYPPNKGDKLRSFHLLQHLAARHRVFLGTFVDDPLDESHIETLRPLCAGVHVSRLNPRFAKIRSLAGLVRGEALTLPYYRNTVMHAWVRRAISEEHIDTAVVFSSSMAQYVEEIPHLRTLIDFVDVDSAKWSQYAPSRVWPLSWIYRREGKRLLAYERATAVRSTRSFFVTEAEAELFGSLAPECREKTEAVCNGVDAAYFSPKHDFPSPFSQDELPVVFTGAMDYWPNVDAAIWFASNVLPNLRARWPRLRFHIVGMRPSPAVQALASEFVAVSGTVPDVRPFIKHAAVLVAPLRVARGIQNKLLEAMAMAKPVVASRACAIGVDAKPGRDLETAYEASDFHQRIDALLRDPTHASAMGRAARERVMSRYSWEAHLSRIDRYLDASSPSAPGLVPSTGGADSVFR